MFTLPLGIPRATQAHHLADNMAIFDFELTQEEMNLLFSYGERAIESDEEL